MKSNRGNFYLHPESKRHAMSLFGLVDESYQIQGGRCWFVTNDNGKRCREIAINSHVVSKGSALSTLMDKSGKVLELVWEPKNWQHLIMQSNPDNVVHWSNPTHYVPPLKGIDSACTGPLACLTHDQQFRKIDKSNLDCNDSDVIFLMLYRVVLYDAALVPHGESLSRSFGRSAASNRSKAVRNIWIPHSRKFENIRNRSRCLATSLGRYWYQRQSLKSLTLPVVKVSEVFFRSRLRFAASLAYAQGGVVSVIPVEDNLHKAIAVSLCKESNSFAATAKQWESTAAISMAENTHGLEVIEMLKSASSGTAAISPDSYQSLNEDDRIKTNGILMQSLKPWYMETILASARTY